MKINETQGNQFLRDLQFKGIIPIEDSAEQPEIRDGVTILGKIDRELASGIVPRELEEISQGEFERDKSTYRHEVFADILPGAMFGGIVGASFTELPALVSNLYLAIPLTCAGAVAGAVVAWLRRRNKSTGNVSVNIDGKKLNEPYYHSPDRYKKSPEMLRFIMKAKGVLGDKIKAHILKDGDLPSTLNSDKLQELRGYSNDLAKLASERRLVASFGEQSRYGKDALQLIDGNLAKDLIAGGKKVYVVNGRETKQIPHHYLADMIKGDNSSHIESMTEVFEYQETKFDYSLTPVNSAADLAGIKKAAGVPEGILGIYENSDTYSEVVFRDKQYGYADIKQGVHSSSEVIRYDHSRNSSVADPAINATASVYPRFVHKFNLPFLLGMIGAVAGGATAIGLGIVGLPAGVMMATGFVTGKFVGRKIIR